jgi:hypothetical protein
MARTMIEFMEAHFRQLPIDCKKYTGERWGKMLLRNIWNMLLRLWETRNEINHGKQAQAEQHTERHRLQHSVRKYYEMIDTLELSVKRRSSTRTRKQCYQRIQGTLRHG